MPITRARLEAYWRETLAIIPPAYDGGVAGWRWVQVAAVPVKKTRWLVLSVEHVDGDEAKVSVPIDDNDMTPDVVARAVASLARVREVPLAELTAKLAEPITFTASATCGVCRKTETVSLVDEMPTIGWPITAGTGAHCRSPACEAEADRRCRAGRAQAATPKSKSKAARPPANVVQRPQSDAERLAAHNALWGDG